MFIYSENIYTVTNDKQIVEVHKLYDALNHFQTRHIYLSHYYC